MNLTRVLSWSQCLTGSGFPASSTHGKVTCCSSITLTFAGLGAITGVTTHMRAHTHTEQLTQLYNTQMFTRQLHKNQTNHCADLWCSDRWCEHAAPFQKRKRIKSLVVSRHKYIHHSRTKLTVYFISNLSLLFTLSSKSFQ